LAYNIQNYKIEELELPYMSSNFIKIWKQPQDPVIRNYFDIHVDQIKYKKFFTSIFIYCIAQFAKKIIIIIVKYC